MDRNQKGSSVQDSIIWLGHKMIQSQATIYAVQLQVILHSRVIIDWMDVP